jgi:phospholipid/cholesterol/gamma-HCH transport system substrate-binding protein
LSYFKLGIFVISATIIGVIGVVVLGVGTLLQKTTLIETYIDESVQGLDVGSAVKFRGVEVGKVEQITLTSVEYPTKRRYVLVRAGLTSTMFQDALADPRGTGFGTEIAKGLRLRLAAQGLTGTAYLEADYLDPARHPPLEIDWQPAYPYVPSGQSRITQLAESVDRILRNVEQVNLPHLIESIEKSLGTMTRVTEINVQKVGLEVSTLLTDLGKTNREFRDLISSEDLKTALNDGAIAAKTARQFIEQAEKPLTQLLEELPKTSRNVNRLVEQLEPVTKDLPEASAQLRQTLSRLNRLIAAQHHEIQTTLENLRTVSEDMREMADNATRYPSQMLFGEPPPRSELVGR